VCQRGAVVDALARSIVDKFSRGLLYLHETAGTITLSIPLARWGDSYESKDSMTTHTAPESYAQLTRYAFDHVKKSWIFGAREASNIAYFAMGAATPALSVVSENVEDGTFFARAEIFDLQEQAELMVALTPGELRVGITLSDSLAYVHGVRDAVSESFDGKPAQMIRMLANGRVMWDHFFNEDPFSAEWIARASNGDAVSRHLLAVRLRYIVETRWRTAMDALVGIGGIGPKGAKRYSLVTTTHVDLGQMCRRLGVIVLDGPRRFAVSDAVEWTFVLIAPEEAAQEMLSTIRQTDPKAALEPLTSCAGSPGIYAGEG